MSDDTSGVLIAFFGLPGAGKSSIASELSGLVGGSLLLEPEEDEWADAVLSREESGYFTAITWFRSIRVPQIHQADAVRRRNGIAILDSYYDKLLSYYLGKPGMEWLIHPDDPYYPAIVQIAALDLELLPDVDCLIFLEVSYEDWTKMILDRGRDLDKDHGFVESYNTQDYFLDAAKSFAASRGAVLVRHKIRFSSPREEATIVHEKLVDLGIVDPPRVST